MQVFKISDAQILIIIRFIQKKKTYLKANNFLHTTRITRFKYVFYNSEDRKDKIRVRQTSSMICQRLDTYIVI